ncbi:hypothetical protein NCC49_004657 [Naganishia albida]|nr:hypothetical protein NCC49_004657 [Naganishia albida]
MPHTEDADLVVAAAESFIEHQPALMNYAGEKLQKAQTSQAEQYNKTKNANEFAEDDLVLLSIKHTYPPFSQGKGSKKLRSNYIGSFRIMRKISPAAYKLDLPAHMRIHPVINVEYPKAFHESPARFSMNWKTFEVTSPTEIGSFAFSVIGLFDDTYDPEANLSNSQELLNAYKREHGLA